MSKPQQPSPFLFLFFLLLATLFSPSHADIGTAAHYSPPYLPSACFGNDGSQFPSNNLFAAAGEGIWDNGASCGREYLVRCISAAVPRACHPKQTIKIRIVDRAQAAVSPPSRGGALMTLSDTAFNQIARPSAPFVNIEYQQV